MENLLPNPQPKLLGGFKTAVGGFIIRGGAFLLLIWLALFCFSVNNASAATLTIDGYTIEISGTTCTITGYSASGGAITIPNTLSDGTISYTVTAIGANAFKNKTGLTSVTIPNNITSIGNYAFKGCSGLTTITIPDDLTSINTWAFEGCSNLTNVTIPNGVISIEDAAFANCTSLTSVTIPRSVTNIGTAFSGCSALQYVYYDGQPTNEDDNAFYLAPLLARYYAASSTTYAITSAATHYTIAPSTTTGMAGETISLKIAVDPGYSLQTLKYNDGSSDYTINGTSFTMPEKAITISAEVLSNISGTLTIGDYTIDTYGTNCIITGYSGSGGAITIPDTLGAYTVTAIGANVFKNKTGLTSVTIPNSVTSIGDYAFKGCSGLTSITIPDNLTSINTWAFEGCSSVTSVTIPNGVISIADFAFSNCTSLTSVTIPKSVTSIGLAFTGCTVLQYVYYDGQPTNIDGNAFYLTEAAYYYSVSSTTYSITSAATHCSITPSTTTGMAGETISLKIAVDSGYSLQSLKYNDGSNDYTINGTSFTMPDKAITIFASMVSSGYTYTDIGNGKCTITAYSGTGGNITIGSTLDGLTVTAIGANAFKDNTSLTGVVIPNSVTSIGDGAFSNCTSLVAAYFRGDKPATLGTGVFSGAASGFTVYIPPGNKTYGGWSEYSVKDYLIYKGAQKKRNGGNYDIRFIATIDTLDPDSVGFVYSGTNETPTIGGSDTQQVYTTTVYTSILANGATKTAESLGGTYIIACPTVTRVSNNDTYYVRAYYIRGTETTYTSMFSVKVANLSLPTQ